MVKSFWETPNGLFSTGLVGAFDSLKKNSDLPHGGGMNFAVLPLFVP